MKVPKASVLADRRRNTALSASTFPLSRSTHGEPSRVNQGISKKSKCEQLATAATCKDRLPNRLQHSEAHASSGGTTSCTTVPRLAPSLPSKPISRQASRGNSRRVPRSVSYVHDIAIQKAHRSQVDVRRVQAASRYMDRPLKRGQPTEIGFGTTCRTQLLHPGRALLTLLNKRCEERAANATWRSNSFPKRAQCVARVPGRSDRSQKFPDFSSAPQSQVPKASSGLTRQLCSGVLSTVSEVDAKLEGTEGDKADTLTLTPKLGSRLLEEILQELLTSDSFLKEAAATKVYQRWGFPSHVAMLNCIEALAKVSPIKSHEDDNEEDDDDDDEQEICSVASCSTTASSMPL